MDESGTTKGVANFSFRGLGVNSSIPSVDPTVGVFIDGVYLGTNYGVVFDQFDLAGIEVLRGPQGLLFGRNVTGGAVVVNTKNPTSEFEGSIRTAIESGLNKYVMASVSGPVIEDKLLAKLAV
jgi:iron complex outermembrane receptor protein